MTEMLNSVKGATGGTWALTQSYDLSPSAVRQAINSTFADASENDVSLFFIATHGDTANEGRYAGALATVDADGNQGWILMEELASWLNEVPGKVIVIIESCGSGAAVYEEGIAENSFNAAVIEAFREVSELNSASKRIGTVYDPQTGEFRSDKFYVLTAARYQQESYGYENEDITRSYNLFTGWLTDGVGTGGSMPADTNGDGQVTLNEMFTYISSVGDNYAVTIKGETYYQNVQVYPRQSSYVLFKRAVTR